MQLYSYLLFQIFRLYLLSILLHINKINGNIDEDMIVNEQIQYPQIDKLVKVCIIGATTYLGSSLLLSLLKTNSINVIGYEQQPRKKLSNNHFLEHSIIYLTYAMIPNHELQSYDYIIYLNSDESSNDLINQSILDKDANSIIELVTRMSKSQVFIFVSTIESIALLSRNKNKDNNIDIHVLNELDEVDDDDTQQYSVLLSKVTDSVQDNQIRMIALRLGTVVGISPNLHTDDHCHHHYHHYISLNTLVCNAFLDGYLTVSNVHIYRSFLWMEDFTRAIQHIISSPATSQQQKQQQKQQSGFQIYNMASIHGSIGKLANHIAWRTGARVEYNNNNEAIHKEGCTLNTSKFSMHWNFTFTEDPDVIIQDLITNIPKLVMKDNELHIDKHISANQACVVCGSKHMVLIADLLSCQQQSTASNDTTTTTLKQVRCTYCNHTQIVSTLTLLPHSENHNYCIIHILHILQSSSSLKYRATTTNGRSHIRINDQNINYFKWLSNKVMIDCLKYSKGNDLRMDRIKQLQDVLDITLDDVINTNNNHNNNNMEDHESLLDYFIPKNWGTYYLYLNQNSSDSMLKNNKRHKIVYSSLKNNEIKFILPNTNMRFDVILIRRFVLEYISNPLDLLISITKIMEVTTSKVYIELSKCSINIFLATTTIIEDPLDCIYNPNQISFFTTHSLVKLLHQARLHIINYENLTNFTLITVMLYTTTESNNTATTTNSMNEHTHMPSSNHNYIDAVYNNLQKEIHLGVTSNWYYVRYQMNIRRSLEWIYNQLISASNLSFNIIGFGISLKGMKLLNSLQNMQQLNNKFYNMQLIVKETTIAWNDSNAFDSLDVNDIPIRAISEAIISLVSQPSSYSFTLPIVILDLLSDTLDICIVNLKPLIVELRKYYKVIYLLVPFPKQILYEVTIDYELQIIAENDYYMMSYPDIFSSSDRKKVLMVNHFYNEEFLMPHFIRSHAHHFDEVIMIDYNSNDSSIEIIKREAPPSWHIVPSRNQYGTATTMDEEVMEYEQRYPYHWKIALTITEFIVHSNLRGQLYVLEKLQPQQLLYHFPDLHMVGNDTIRYNPNKSLLHQRSMFVYNTLHAWGSFKQMYARVIHRDSTLKYYTGRHSTDKGHGTPIPGGILLKYMFTPWPELKHRKLQFQTKLSETDIHKAFFFKIGYQHLTNENYLEMQRYEKLFGDYGFWELGHLLKNII